MALQMHTIWSPNSQSIPELHTLRLMDKILHYLKDPKLWELWYTPYHAGFCPSTVSYTVSIPETPHSEVENSIALAPLRPNLHPESQSPHTKPWNQAAQCRERLFDQLSLLQQLQALFEACYRGLNNYQCYFWGLLLIIMV